MCCYKCFFFSPQDCFGYSGSFVNPKPKVGKTKKMIIKKQKYVKEKTEKAIYNNSKTKNWFFEENNKICQPSWLRKKDTNWNIRYRWREGRLTKAYEETVQGRVSFEDYRYDCYLDYGNCFTCGCQDTYSWTFKNYMSIIPQ